MLRIAISGIPDEWNLQDVYFGAKSRFGVCYTQLLYDGLTLLVPEPDRFTPGGWGSLFALNVCERRLFVWNQAPKNGLVLLFCDSEEVLIESLDDWVGGDDLKSLIPTW